MDILFPRRIYCAGWGLDVHRTFPGFEEAVRDMPLPDGKPGAGAGASAMVLSGSSELLDSSVGKLVLPDPVPVLPTSYWENVIPSLALHFEVNGASFIRLTEAEEEKIRKEKRLITRDALAAFAAYELPILSHSLAKLAITGHADMPDTKAKNRELSKNRAESVHNLLQSFLGSRFLAGRSREEAEVSKHLVINGSGEADAAGQEVASEHKYDPRFRRTDLKLFLHPLQESERDVSALTWSLTKDDKSSSKK